MEREQSFAMPNHGRRLVFATGTLTVHLSSPYKWGLIEIKAEESLKEMSILMSNTYTISDDDGDSERCPVRTRPRLVATAIGVPPRNISRLFLLLFLWPSVYFAPLGDLNVKLEP